VRKSKKVKGGGPLSGLLNMIGLGEPVVEGEGKKKRVRKSKKGKGEEVEGEGKKMSKAKIRGLAVAKVMKEKGVKLGEASKIVSEMIKLKGSGFWDDFASGFSSVMDVGMKILPFVL